jgi:hypothetical protein
VTFLSYLGHFMRFALSVHREFKQLLSAFATISSFGNILKYLRDNLRPSHNNIAAMADNPSHDELISQFVDLTGASPEDVSLASFSLAPVTN